MSDRVANPLAAILRFNAFFGDLTKRIFDIVIALGVLVLLSPLLGLIVLAIRRDSPGPILYRGPRLGRGGKVFKMLKFRTMYENPASYTGPKVTAYDDPRVTSLGRWLRATKLNELPQFWNVLKGDMSLVGPRPEDPNIAKTWPQAIWEELVAVRPGVTSPASIEYRNEENLLCAGNVMQQYMQELVPDKMRLDQLYVRNRSLLLDLDILFWTALLLLPRLRAYPLPEQLLFVGPITRLMRRYLSWFSIDLLITFGAIAFVGLAWRLSTPLNVGWARAAAAAVVFALVFSLSGALLGVNRISWSSAASTDAYDLLPAWGLAAGVVLVANWQLGIFPIELVLAASLLALGGYIVARYRSRLITGLFGRLLREPAINRTRERVLIIGSGPAAQHAAWLLAHPMIRGRLQVAGFVDNDLFKQGLRIYGAPVLGTCQDLPELMKKFDTGVVLVADELLAKQEINSIAGSCLTQSAKLLVLPDILACLGGLADMAAPGQEAGSEAAGESVSPCLYCLTRLAAPRLNLDLES